jgi:hypothetical protein
MHLGARHVALVLLGCATLQPLVDGAAADPRFHGGRVYVANENCSGRTYRPTSIVLACADGGLVATRIRFRSYGGARALGSAELRVHECIPDCAESRAYRTYTVSLTLRDVVRCEGTLFYSRVTYTFVGPQPPGWGPPRADIEPFGEDATPICSAVLG